jgi:DNA-binding response OmpR family regulator
MDVSRSILIIDHEIDLYAELLALLQRFHYSCSFAQTGLDALTALKTGSFDLILLELRLLDVEGNCLFSMIRRLCPKSSSAHFDLG